MQGFIEFGQIDTQGTGLETIDIEEKPVSYTHLDVYKRQGATYTDAKLKLVAGDINIAREPSYVAKDMMAMEAAAAPAPGVQQREFFEYHLYEVQRPVTVKDNSTKQIEFVTAQDVPASKFYVYDGSAGYGLSLIHI